MEHLAPIITAISALVLGVFGVYQYRINKNVDYRLEKQREIDKLQAEERTKIKAEACAKIYGRLHQLLRDLDADRVYIVQAHPPNEKHYISITIEILHPYRDVTDWKEETQNYPMSRWAWLVGKLADEEFLAFGDIASIPDTRMRAECAKRGIQSIYMKRLQNERSEWVGSLFVDFTHRSEFDVEKVNNAISAQSYFIQHILPEYHGILPPQN